MVLCPTETWVPFFFVICVYEMPFLSQITAHTHPPSSFVNIISHGTVKFCFWLSQWTRNMDDFGAGRKRGKNNSPPLSTSSGITVSDLCDSHCCQTDKDPCVPGMVRILGFGIMTSALGEVNGCLISQSLGRLIIPCLFPLPFYNPVHNSLH